MAPADVVVTFLNAVMRDKDFDLVETLLAEDVRYENVGYSAMTGAQRMLSTFRGMAARMPWLNWDVEIHRMATEGETVLTERTDSILIGRFRADFWVCGRFEVRDGRVQLWRDYFDALDLVKGLVRGVAALVASAGRGQVAHRSAHSGAGAS
ncbi:limonene-1,2-epoxide hydrolase family protein [Mycobacterium sp. NAZ190054]|uniref:limonene-1,2-epoxide hydrolase family protein n=1 Tax=Mycobacterium sp. NAZ190054 TaxID=1747766 RepID=UPI00079A5EA6|nr:limonene-1,2-epoxide hydrolase family protein [Mycobacterium sp. NAZ190054]KWX65603.1 hypothetical protein ASJ79_01170 [Mycobacterium sp. NAZ190054]